MDTTSTSNAEASTKFAVEELRRNDESSICNENESVERVNSSKLPSLPLLPLRRILFKDDIRCQVLLTTGFRGFTGSSKDYLAKRILHELENSGDVNSDTVLITYSSGDLSISLAFSGIEKKYKVVSILPFDTPLEKLWYLRALGSKIILAPESSNLSFNYSSELISIAQRIHSEIQNSYIIHPYEDSPAAHVYYGEIAEDIISQCGSSLSMIVFDPETSGMVKVLPEKIKKSFPSCHIIGIQTPEFSAIKRRPNDAGKTSNYKIETELELLEELSQPSCVKFESIIDDWITVEDKKSLCTYVELLECDGLLAGANSGAIVAGAIEAITKYGIKDEEEAKVVLILQEAHFEQTKNDFMDKRVLLENNFLTNDYLSKKKWWWGVLIGNLHMKAPLIFSKDSIIGNVTDILGKQNGVVMDKDAILGVVTPKLKLIRESVGESGWKDADIFQKPISEVPGCFCTDFRIVDHSSKTLGDVSLLLKQTTFLIITGITTEIAIAEKESENTGHGNNIVQTVIGVLTNMDILRYITKVEGHHRKQSNWDVKTNTLIKDGQEE